MYSPPCIAAWLLLPHTAPNNTSVCSSRFQNAFDVAARAAAGRGVSGRRGVTPCPACPAVACGSMAYGGLLQLYGVRSRLAEQCRVRGGPRVGTKVTAGGRGGREALRRPPGSSRLFHEQLVRRLV